MSRYIDADEFIADLEAESANLLLDGLKGTPRPRELSFKGVIDRINEVPTADVKEVVRCKDCEYYRSKNSLGTQGVCMCGEMEFNYGGEFYPMANDFCSYGRKKREY